VSTHGAVALRVETLHQLGIGADRDRGHRRTRPAGHRAERVFATVETPERRDARQDWMAGLDSALETLVTEPVVDLPDARLEEDFLELHRRLERLEVERLRRLAAIDRRKLYARDGHLSAASWLVGALRLAWGTAREQVRMARGLEQMPETRQALSTGDVSLSSARTLVGARNIDPVAFSRAEAELVEAARIHSSRDLERIAAFWRERVAHDGPLGREETLRARRRLHASVTFAGMVRIDGDLDPETGETVLTALSAVLDAEARSGSADERTPAQRRADALGEICRESLDLAGRQVAGERPHVTVTVAGGDLAATGPGVAELDHLGPVDVEVARRVSCDASVMRVVMAAPSEPLDVGRRTPVVPSGLRRAVIVRDRVCRFPGCDRPHPWCDAHHVVHWADGGTTELPNLLLLCRRHHRTVHDRAGGFRLEMLDGRPVFTRPDGSILEDDRAPP
jgi:hypothetical protein